MDDSIFGSIPNITGSTNAEQMVSASKDLAAVMAAYYFELIRVGVPEQYAAFMTVSYQAAMISGGHKPSDGQ